MKDRSSMDMTQGPLLGNILWFVFPLMAANLSQLLFNAADIVVVGRFAGRECLAAVSSTTSVIYLLLNLLIGLTVGVNVVIAHYIGMRNHEKEISKALHTALVVAIWGGLLFFAFGFLASGPLLRTMSVPEDVLPLSCRYLRIYLAGTSFSGIYNYGAAALRACGDTRRPLIFMLVSGALNIAANMLFVICFHWNVTGVALATVLSQAASAALILRCLNKRKDAMHFSWEKLRPDWDSFCRLVRIGLPAGTQSSLFSLSNVVIQGAINSYGSIIMAGSGAAANLEGLLYVCMNAFHLACQTFVGQNLGAGNYRRVSQIVRTCLMCTLILGITQSVLACIFSQTLIGMYNTDAAVIQAGSFRLWRVALLYVLFGLSDVLVGAIRGCGIPIVPMIINLLGTCVFRLVWVGMLDTTKVGVETVYASYPISWVLVLVVMSLYWMLLKHRGFDRIHSVAD